MMEQVSFTCSTCNKQFKTKNALSAHMRVHNKKPIHIDPPNTSNIPNVDQDTLLRAFQMLEEGHTPFEVMQTYKLDIPTLKSILQNFNEIKMFTRLERPTSDMFLQIMRIFGERIRDACDSYNDEYGICLEYSLYDIDEDLRRSFPGLFKGFGGKTRFHVGNHPWICAICRKGVRRGESL